ncbi:hypothetical protein FF38_01478 [Lucilia cuprina]|uniref:Uncharacterized protein n=1 Tax=Lucilia cuprina TaxID=7375 RepID=A0A0L0C0A6_LUCCU|nr:hypothetical protein FF38_01478 [Lucilia cuprina]
MQDYCLAHFAAYYKFSKSRPSRNRRHQEEEYDCNKNNDFNEDNSDGNEIYIKLRDGVDDDNLEENRAVTQLLGDEFRALAVPELDANINVIHINDDYINTDESKDGV